MSNEPDHYEFIFSGISDSINNTGELQIIDHRVGREVRMPVAVHDEDVLKQWKLYLQPRIADLIDLAVAVSEADRWSKRHVRRNCNIEVCLPVRCPEVFNASEFQLQLSRLMYWFTGENWSFKFTRTNGQRLRVAEQQETLKFDYNKEISTEVALWSGGLDALAGLCCRIEQSTADRYLLFGGGGNPKVQGLQSKIHALIAKEFPVEIRLTQILIEKRGTKGDKLRPDRRLRARGIVFMLLGATYALLEGQHKLKVYENGVGALNLPYRKSEVGLDHTRAVHPLSLIQISQLVSMISGEDFIIENPFLFQTKGQMCSSIKSNSIQNIVWQTVSCDREHRKPIPQCGRCTSCVLRKEAIMVAGLTDRTQYLIETENDDLVNSLRRSSHLPHMLFQVEWLRRLLAGPDPWNSLAHMYPSLVGDLPERLYPGDPLAQKEFIDRILSLYKTYIDEWSLELVMNSVNKELEAIHTPARTNGEISTPLISSMVAEGY